MNIVVLDCETTGFDPETQEIVEIAGAVIDPKKKKIISKFETLVNPGIPIPPDAMGIHHILDKHVIGMPSLEHALNVHIVPLGDITPAAHNAEFDSKFIPIGEVSEWICTYRCAKHLYPDSPSFSNQTLRYYLKLFKEPEAGAMPPHRAPADVWVTSHILLRMLVDRTPEQLLLLTAQPILLKTIHFGKHRGELWSDAPKDYLKWVLRSDFDKDVMHTARHYYG